MKVLSLTIGAGVLVTAQTTLGTPSFAAGSSFSIPQSQPQLGVTQTYQTPSGQFPQVTASTYQTPSGQFPQITASQQLIVGAGTGTPLPYQQALPYQPSGQYSFAGTYGQGVPNPFSANKPSNWVNSPPSIWTPAGGQSPVPISPTPAQTPRPPNPALAGRSPSEQLQITKCRSAQSCGKCRQLNCYWDTTAQVTNRCIALGLESTQIPISAGQASSLGYCPTSGQTGFVGVNWLEIENLGVSVPNLQGMSDADVQQWLSTVQNYNPDDTAANYPAGTAFQELLPTAASAYASGKIPTTTPWISFFDSTLNGGGYSYDGGYDSSYTYDLPSTDSYGGSSYGGGSYGGGAFPSVGGASFQSVGGSAAFPSIQGLGSGLQGLSVGSQVGSAPYTSFQGSLGGGSSLFSSQGAISGGSSPFTSFSSQGSSSPFSSQGSFGGSFPASSDSSLPNFASAQGSTSFGVQQPANFGVSMSQTSQSNGLSSQAYSG